MAFLRANPAWSEPMTIFIAGIGDSLSEKLLGGGDDVFGSEAELLEDILQRGGCAERPHADGFTLEADVVLPAEGGGHFHRNARRDCRRQNTLVVGGVLAVEQFPARHADYASLDAFSGELFLRGDT